MTNTSHEHNGLLPGLDGGTGPALPIGDDKMHAMIGAAIAGGMGPGGGEGPAGGDGGLGTSGTGAASSGSFATKAAVVGLALGAAVVGAVVVSGAFNRGTMVSDTTPVPRPTVVIPTAAPEEVETTRTEDAPTKAVAPVPEPKTVGTKNRPRRATPPRPEKTRTPDDLLRLANQARKRRAWRAANDLYVQVRKRHPRTRAAYVATVASAQLNLGKLSRSAVALRLFKAALQREPRGFLAEEARFGIAQAHRSLGKKSAESVSLRTFLRRHPGSPLAPRARVRLRALSGGKTD